MEPEEKKPSQQTLFSDLDDFTLWKKEWKGMPEFVQGDLMPLQSVLIHFETQEDVDAFAKLIGQRITPLTKSRWYPEVKISRYIDKRYEDES